MNNLALSAYIFLICFIISCAGLSIPNPLHASCKLEWQIGQSCDNAGTAITGQIKKWSGKECGDGEKCRYTLVHYGGGILNGTHETPSHHYVDTFSMVFKQTESDGSCNIAAKSSSNTWYAVLDYGTNYCNLHNLITGSGLDKSPGFKETTSDDICTQYSSADCDKY